MDLADKYEVRVLRNVTCLTQIETDWNSSKKSLFSAISRNDCNQQNWTRKLFFVHFPLQGSISPTFSRDFFARKIRRLFLANGVCIMAHRFGKFWLIISAINFVGEIERRFFAARYTAMSFQLAKKFGEMDPCNWSGKNQLKNLITILKWFRQKIGRFNFCIFVFEKKPKNGILKNVTKF